VLRLLEARPSTNATHSELIHAIHTQKLPTPVLELRNCEAEKRANSALAESRHHAAHPENIFLVASSVPSKMAKAAPSKKTAKTAKAAAAAGGEGGKKKARKASRVESYNTYIYKVLKQVHPGESHC
jgi:hypothetical protein